MRSLTSRIWLAISDFAFSATRNRIDPESGRFGRIEGNPLSLRDIRNDLDRPPTIIGNGDSILSRSNSHDFRLDESEPSRSVEYESPRVSMYLHFLFKSPRSFFN